MQLSSMSFKHSKYEIKYKIHGYNVPNSNVNFLFPEFLKTEELTFVTINGFKYIKNCIIITDISENNLEFGMVSRIYNVNDKIKFEYIKLQVYTFDNHFFAYHVISDTTNTNHIDFDNLASPIICTYFIIKNKEYVVTRHIL